MSNKFKYHAIDLKGFLKDFHKSCEQYDDNYIRAVHMAVLMELRCRNGQITFQRFIDDFKPRSMVVGCSNPHWWNR